MLARPSLVLLLALGLPSGLAGQTEEDLKRYFEGKRVTLRLDMPGTEQGVDIHPGTDRPLDYPRYADRLKDHGTAIEAGEADVQAVSGSLPSAPLTFTVVARADTILIQGDSVVSLPIAADPPASAGLAVRAPSTGRVRLRRPRGARPSARPSRRAQFGSAVPSLK